MYHLKQNAPTQPSPEALSRTALPRSLLNSQSTVRAPDAEGHVRNTMLITSGACLLQCLGWLRLVCRSATPPSSPAPSTSPKVQSSLRFRPRRGLMIVCSANPFGLRPRLASLFQFAAVFALLFGCL